MRLDLEYVDFLQIVSMSAEKARAFVAGTPYAKQEPLDLGPADERYKPGARIWGFRPQPKTGDFTTRGGRA